MTPDPGTLYSTTDAILISGLSADCLRRYEKDGLIHPIRTARGARLYRLRDLDTAKQVYADRAKRCGMTGTRRFLAPTTDPHVS